MKYLILKQCYDLVDLDPTKYYTVNYKIQAALEEIYVGQFVRSYNKIWEFNDNGKQIQIEESFRIQ
jgi:hypothetical protein